MRAKSHWAYDPQFLDSARADWVIDPEEMRSSTVYLLERDDRIIGFYGVVGDPPHGRLEWMFLEPEAIGGGYGRLIWNHASSTRPISRSC